MPDKENGETGEKKKTSNTGWIVQIIVPLITVIGTIVVAYFGYKGVVTPLRLSLQATQTAEARATYTPTKTLTPSATVIVTPSVTFTPTITQTPIPRPPTFTPSIPPSGVKYCVDSYALNVRNGPGMIYDVVGALYQDDCLFFDGQVILEEIYYWVHISPNQVDFLSLAGGWVYGGALRPQDFERLPALTPPPPPVHSPTPIG